MLDRAEGLLSRLHRVYTIMATPKTRPPLLDDKAFAKVADAFAKSFPKIPTDPAKLSGYDQLVSQAQGLHEQLAQAYYSFVDAGEWVSLARETLNELKTVTCLKYDVNPRLTEAFLDLLQVYMRILFFIQQIGDRQLILSVFCRAYFHMKYVNEPSFDKTAEFVASYTEVVPRVQADVRNVASQIVDAIMSLYMPFVSNTDVGAIRSKGMHNLILKPDNMALPSDDPQLYDLMRQQKNYLRIAYGLLPCGESFARVTPEIVGSVLQEAILAPLYREVSIDLTSRYNFMLKNFKPKKGDVPADVLKELTKNMAAVKKCVDFAEKFTEREVLSLHHQRRVYVRLELQNLLSLLRDKPGLLAPKATLLLSVLAMARDEIMWLVRHQTGPLPKGCKVKPEDLEDKRVTDIVYLVNQLVTLARTYKAVIRDYYVECLSGVDLRVAQKEAGSVMLPPGAKVKSLMDGIFAEVQSLQPGGAEYNFSGLRLNWFRVESWLSSSESSVFVEPVKVLVSKFTQLCRHSEYVDNLDGVMEEYASLGDFWYSRESFKQLFVNAIAGGPTQPQRCMVYLRLLAEFAVRPNLHVREEQENRGRACVLLGRHFLERIALCINNGLVITANQFAKFDEQLNEMNAAYGAIKDLPSFKPAKDFVPPEVPGAESGYARRRELEGLRQTQGTTYQLCSALNEDVSIQIFDTLFTPREFVRERLMLTLKEFLFKNVMASDGNIERPVVLERRINNFCSVFILVENYLDINVSAIFRETFVSQVCHNGLSEMSSPLGGAVPSPSEWEDCMIKPLVIWYVQFVTTHLMGADKSAVVWSPNRKAFVSKTGNAFRAEEYVNVTELRALCRLIGPYGVKLIDGEVLKIVAAVTRKLKETVSDNRAACLELQKLFVEKDGECLQAYKQFRNLDVVVALHTNIGLALHFRELLHEALGHVMQELVPFMRDAVESAFLQYARNTFMVEEYVACDILAYECGINVGTADQVLKYALKDALGSSADDVQLWSLLPTLTAASLLSKSWNEADYRAGVEGYRTNLHCMAKSLSQLIVCFKSLTSQTRNELEIQLLLEVFLEQSTVLLLRASQTDAKVLQKLLGGQTVTGWADTLIFLDLFLEQAPYLERQTLERILPYPLLRSMYGQVYTTKEVVVQSTIRAKKKENVDGV